MTATRRILVVDDETNARAALAELLRDEGFDVVTAASGGDALGMVAVYRPHLAIVDLELGMELVGQLLRCSEAPSVIAMTAFGDTDGGVDALKAGASDYLTKPVRFDELLVVVARVLREHELEREVDRLRDRLRIAEL